jgi:hypothetical protein
MVLATMSMSAERGEAEQLDLLWLTARSYWFHGALAAVSAKATTSNLDLFLATLLIRGANLRRTLYAMR